MSTPPLIVGLGGTTRGGSTSEQALKRALDHARFLGCEVKLIAGPELPTEIYDPARTERSANARALVQALQLADGVLIASPAYHGGVSGLIKNALDYTEDLRSDVRTYLEGRAVGCIVCAEGAQAMGATLGNLRAIIHSLRAWNTPFSATINSSSRPFNQSTGQADPVAVQACELVCEQVVEFARMHQGR